MKFISYSEYKKTLKELGISYIGSYSQSAKLVKNEEKKVLTYGIYMAPWTQASTSDLKINVCPGGQHCHKYCLNGSGRNKMDILAHGEEHSRITRSRIVKTRFFFQNRDLFCRMVAYEILQTRKKADRMGFGFSVRLNCTQDISPELYRIGQKNLLEIFSDVQFYDYTKVRNRFKLVEKYDNYHLTFSYDGKNWEACKKFLDHGINIAVVFESHIMPVAWRGYSVIDMTKTDLRYTDPKSNEKGFVGYLEYHRTANDYIGGVYHRPDDPFVIREDDPQVLYQFEYEDVRGE